MATSVTFQFWRSADNIDWSDGPYSDIADVPDARYIKVRTTLTRDDDKMPVLEDMTVGYFKRTNILANWIFFNETAKDIDLTCPMCQERIGGICVNIPAGEMDPINGCIAEGYRCDGHGNCVACPTCKEWSGGNCVNITAGLKDTVGPNKCIATHYRCDGNGNCIAPTHTVSGPCLTWTGVSSNCAAWCPAHGYISCVELWYYLWDAHCGTFERTYPCSGSWSAADAGRSWKCRCKDYVYD